MEQRTDIKNKLVIYYEPESSFEDDFVDFIEEVLGFEEINKKDE